MDIVEKGGASAIYHAISEEDVERILKHPATGIGSDGAISVFGDAVPHPREYGTFARVLGHYVRERKVITLEDAIRKMTSLTAQRLGIRDRGEGCFFLMATWIGAGLAEHSRRPAVAGAGAAGAGLFAALVLMSVSRGAALGMIVSAVGLVALLPGRGSLCKGLAFSPNRKRLLLWSIVPTLLKLP